MAAVLAAIGGGGGAAGGGGDFVMPHTDTFQALHIDLGDAPFHQLDTAPAIAVNFVLADLPCSNAPLRIVPAAPATRSISTLCKA